MSQSLSSNMPDNSPEQEAATGHSIPRRLDSPTSQATQLPELELTLTLTTGQNEISLLQISVADVEDRRAEDHDQIQIILALLGL
ncbi:hypothetical protein Tco_1453621 [Tanacetum coccineum]